MIYLDNAATTRPSLKAIEKASVFNRDKFFNPSALYQGGVDNAREIKNSKEKLLKHLGVTSTDYDVIYTSCGSESDNTAILCARKRGVFVTSKGEHAAVYKTFIDLKQKGLQVEFIDLNEDGSVNLEKLFEYVKTNQTDFVSIVHVNNETGAINDVNFIAEKLKEIDRKIVFHVDGVQAFGKLPYKLSNKIDMYSISAHKINGLKGVGALIKRKNLVISPLIQGGGQENGLRSGTENIFGIKVFEYVCDEHFSSIKDDYQKVSDLKKHAIDNLDKQLFHVISSEKSSPYVLCITAKGLRGEVIMHSLEEYGVIIGNGSACSSKNRYSRVIEACGYNKDYLDGVIRISFSNESTLEEVKEAVYRINTVVKKLKGIMS